MNSVDKRFIQTALALAEIWSKDKTKVAAVAVGAQRNQVAWGYNGFPPGIRDSDFRLADRDTKLALTIHAEVNALINAKFDVETLYVTHAPCAKCALNILAYRTVRRVVYFSGGELGPRWAESLVQARAVLSEAGVALEGVVL